MNFSRSSSRRSAPRRCRSRVAGQDGLWRDAVACARSFAARRRRPARDAAGAPSAVTPCPAATQSARPVQRDGAVSPGLASEALRASGSLRLPATSIGVDGDRLAGRAGDAQREGAVGERGPLVLGAPPAGFATSTRAPELDRAGRRRPRAPRRAVRLRVHACRGSGAAGGVRSTRTRRVAVAVSGAMPIAVTVSSSSPSGSARDVEHGLVRRRLVDHDGTRAGAELDAHHRLARAGGDRHLGLHREARGGRGERRPRAAGCRRSRGRRGWRRRCCRRRPRAAPRRGAGRRSMAAVFQAAGEAARRRALRDPLAAPQVARGARHPSRRPSRCR